MLKYGIGAAHGYAMGPAFLLKEPRTEVQKVSISKGDIDHEIIRFDRSVQEAIQQLKIIQENVRGKMGNEEADIFSAHLLLLKDPEYINAVKDKITSERVNAEYALQEVTNGFIVIFESMDNEYMRERATDIRDVSGRVLRNLLGIKTTSLEDISQSVVLIAHDLTPSDTAQLNREKIAGFATNVGGRTSHSAIMARSMEIQAVVGLQDITEIIKPDDFVILDGETGTIIVNPTFEQILDYKGKIDEYRERKEEYKKLTHEASVTADGIQIELVANIGNPEDARAALKNGAEGIGLFRTEFLYMGRNTMPSEEEQFQAYKIVAETFPKNKPIVIRTLDIGGDKELSYLDMPKEMNPFLGYRAIRLCLDQIDIFKTQLRAILRASYFGNIKLMYPMISSLQELREANQILQEVRQELGQKNILFNPQMEVGMMIEVPAAAIIADQLAKEVDFFSIGTNDLIQYTMACDRMNEKISYLYQPLNPSVLRLIHMVIQAAHKEGKWVGMCGEMAGNPFAIPILLGLGLDEFSMSASSILPARALLRELNKAELIQLAEQILHMGTAEEIQAFVERNIPVPQISHKS